ncbi:E3 ubiquitin-protein ligase Mdm2-like isoform X1 [Scylla paramamosain]|uniref:E3 ubiquitin-protein ligase Mdm2-like isoform X1 n=2 Tax=Scylla paramamosain TaxID=85552 RepID=UPI003083B881
MGVSRCYLLEGWRGGGGVTMPPDLTPETRPLAENPLRSCEDDTRSPPPLPGTADHSSSSNGGGLQLPQESPASTPSPSNTWRVGQVGCGTGTEAGVGTRGAAPSASPVVNTYRLSPELRAAFVSVGATDSAYSFREVLLLLKNYLFSNVSLFDPDDKLYINCESDPLGKALGVKRFHFNDVRSLISQNIIKVRPVRGPPCPQVPTPVPDNISSSVCAGGSNDSTCRLSVPVGATPSIPGDAIVVSDGVPNLENVATPSSEAGVSRVCGRQRSLPGPSNPPPDITCPDIPDSCSDAETIYSVQDYETEYCHNTEYESSEEEDLMEVNSDTYEEYELPSDDAKDEKEQCSDSDSSIDDVEIAVLAYTLVQDELEEGFWADDDSVTDSGRSDEEDNDPECVSDRWDCLTCGLKNKPFVRYCSKCWQLRKNWLPDPPKKRRRKPRPKKKNARKRMASGPSEQSTSQGASHWKDQNVGTMSESSADDSSQPDELIRTSSLSTTISGSCTQDSGCFSSQDLLESQEQTEDLVKEQCVEERTVSEASVSKDSSEAEKEQCVEERTVSEASVSKDSSEAEKQSLEETVQPKMLRSRKRKSSSSEYFTAAKRLKRSEDKDEVPFGDAETLAKETFKFISSSAGKAWLSSPGGTKFARSLQASPAYQESMTKMIAEQTSASTSGSASGISMLCSICCLRPKNASIIHGRLAHQATCYQCARRLLNDGARCPVCRRKIHMVCKQILA